MKTSKKILIVDDDVDVINIVQTILENEGHKVLIANGKDEALKVMETEKPDLAILDVMMDTQYEGFELAGEIRNTPKYNNIPVLMQTSIEVFESPDEDAMNYARLYRANIKDDNLDVLLIQDPISGNSGVDYRNEFGKIVWLPIDGFIRKPVKAVNLLESVNRFM